MAAPQLLILGLDGATWRLFEPWARTGRLPHLAALMARGTWGTLRSTVPALTLPAWSSFMTGRNPGGHGVFAFRRLATTRYGLGGLANASDLRARTIWEIAGRAGKRVGVINLPPSYPIRPVNGFVVGCMLTPPGEPLTYPPEIQSELEGYEIDQPVPPAVRQGGAGYREGALTFLEGMRRQTVARAEAALRLMVRHPVDALCAVFYAPDRVQHYFWHYANPDQASGAARDPEIERALAAVYAALDAAVGDLVAAAGPEARVVVLSDHGFTNSPGRAVHINRWLADEGLLHQRPFWSLRRKIVRKVLPPGLRTRYDTTDHILVNRAKTRAWSEAIFTSTAGVWVHLAGKYPLGSVRPGTDYEEVRSRICDGLRALRADDGEPVFERVDRREDVYRGPFVTEAPDVVAVCRPRFGVVFESQRRDLRAGGLFSPYTELGYTGTHESEGIYLFAGPGVRALGKGDEYPIEAIAPTVLHLLGIAVPRSMEAPACTFVLTDEYATRHPLQFVEDEEETVGEVPAWRSDEDEASVADHLRGLGYLE